jgi:peptidyl-prolyl cis-trans isomerase SurA
MSYIDMHQVVPEFTEAAWSIDSLNVVSDETIRSKFGYHLVKITDERDYSSFEAASDHLEELLDNLPRSNNLERKTARRLLNKHGYTVDSTVVETAIGQLPAENAWEHLRTNGFGAEFSDRSFASIGDSTYTLGQLTAQLDEMRTDTTVTAKVHTGINRFLRDKAYAYVVPSLREDNPEFARILNEYENGLLLFRVSEEVVWNQAQEDTAALRELYEDIGDNYRFPERHRAIVFRTIVDTLLQPVQQGLEQGLDISSIYERVNREDLDVEIDTVFVSDSTNQMYGEVIGLEPGQYTDMISRGARDMILYLDGIEAPRQKTFEEARTELLKEHQERLEQQWIEELHDRYDVHLYPERLRYAFTDSTVDDTPLPDRLPSGVVSD